MINQVNKTILHGFLSDIVDIGPRPTGSVNCTQAAHYIYTQFQSMGLWVQYEPWKYKKLESKNVIATLNGTDPKSDAIIIMCAHYDTWPGSPGALDNGAGVATILTAAEIMSTYTFNHTIRFIAFSGEEIGLYGSFSSAKNNYDKRENIYAVINIDEPGYAASMEGGQQLLMNHPERSNWVTDYSTIISIKYMHMINLTAIPVPYLPWGDHNPFAAYGYDSVMYISRDWDVPWNHKPTDTIEKINQTYHEKATKLLLAIVAEFATNPINIQVRITKPYEGYVHLFNYPLRNMKILPYMLNSSWYMHMNVPTILIGKSLVHAEISSKADISGVVFCVDGNVIDVIDSPPYCTKITKFYKPPLSEHQLSVYAFDINGKWSRDEMNFIQISGPTLLEVFFNSPI
jgi:hypothetical protein